MNIIPLQISKIQIPSYLSYFITDFQRIEIIHSKRPSIASQSEDVSEPLPVETLNNSLNECDLTGDPLLVDLGEDEDYMLPKVEVVNNWSKEEAKHYPLSITVAREELGKILQNADENGTSYELPIFVICDGNNAHRTFVLGYHVNSYTSYCLNILEIIPKEEASYEIENMVKYHTKVCNNKAKEISYITKMHYNICGRSFKNLNCQNSSMRDLDNSCSVSVSVSCNERVFNVFDARNVNMVMNLELIAGHKNLSLEFLWREMFLLQTYLDIILDSQLPLNDHSILCKNPLESDDILRRIEKLVKTRYLRISDNEAIDLNHLREGNLDFLDQLWNILKYCENVSVLRNSLHFLFEDIVESNNKSIVIRDTSSNIALLINGILNGKLILSAITYQQAVELLFELGAYKLKNDFQIILKQFSPAMKSGIDTVWKGFTKQPELSQNKTRKTRVTQSLQHSQLEMKTKQLAYLSQLYVGAEFIYIVKEQAIQDKTFYSLYDYINKEYVSKSDKFIDFLEVYQSPLCEMTWPLDLKNIKIIQDYLPSNWTLHMTSKIHNVTNTTIYNLTESSIFPPCIYDYDVPLTDNAIYFVSRMSISKGLF